MEFNSKKEWFPFIDSIKGFAIFLVVMGHVIAWQFEDYSVVPDKKILFWWTFIYTFHMPLFFFVSGFLFPKGIHNIKDVMKSVWKRIKALMVPYVVASIIGLYLMGGGSYWFLMTLFEFSLITIVGNYLNGKIQKGIYFDIIYFIAVFVILRLAVKIIPNDISDLIDMDRLNSFNCSAFFLGTFVRKSPRLLSIFERKSLYTIAILLFGILFTLLIKYNQVDIFWVIPWAGTPLAAIIIFWRLFKFEWMDGCIIRILQYLGKHSMEIYILHFYFCIKLPIIGTIVSEMMTSQSYYENATGTMIQLIACLIVSVIIILMCIVSFKVIRISSPLSQMLFGRK